MSKCFYCEKNDADDSDYFQKETLYLVVSRGTNVSFRYITRDVEIERCKVCHDEQTKYGWIVHLITFLVIIIIVISAFRTTPLKEWYLILFAGFIGFFIGRFASLIVLHILNFISRNFFNKIMLSKTKPSEDYPLIKNMLKIGWLLNRPDPAGSSADESYKKYKEYIQNGGHI